MCVCVCVVLKKDNEAIDEAEAPFVILWMKIYSHAFRQPVVPTAVDLGDIHHQLYLILPRQCDASCGRITQSKQLFQFFKL